MSVDVERVSDVAPCRTPMACDCCAVDPVALACEMLVLRALEVLGKRLVREAGHKHRWQDRGDAPWYALHTVWETSARDIDGALRGAWEMVDEVQMRWGSRDRYDPLLASKLDRYTRRLVDDRRLPVLDELSELLTPVSYAAAAEPRPQIPRDECVDCGRRG